MGRTRKKQIKAPTGSQVFWWRSISVAASVIAFNQFLVLGLIQGEWLSCLLALLSIPVGLLGNMILFKDRFLETVKNWPTAKLKNEQAIIFGFKIKENHIPQKFSDIHGSWFLFRVIFVFIVILSYLGFLDKFLSVINISQVAQIIAGLLIAMVVIPKLSLVPAGVSILGLISGTGVENKIFLFSHLCIAVLEVGFLVAKIRQGYQSYIAEEFEIKQIAKKIRPDLKTPILISLLCASVAFVLVTPPKPKPTGPVSQERSDLKFAKFLFSKISSLQSGQKSPGSGQKKGRGSGDGDSGDSENQGSGMRKSLRIENGKIGRASQGGSGKQGSRRQKAEFGKGNGEVDWAQGKFQKLRSSDDESTDEEAGKEDPWEGSSSDQTDQESGLNQNEAQGTEKDSQNSAEVTASPKLSNQQKKEMTKKWEFRLIKSKKFILYLLIGGGLLCFAWWFLGSKKKSKAPRKKSKLNEDEDEVIDPDSANQQLWEDCKNIAESLAQKKLSPRQTIVALYHALIKYYASIGFERNDYDTPDEYLWRHAEKWPRNVQQIKIVTSLFNKVMYSDFDPNFKDVDQCLKNIQILYSQNSDLKNA